MNEEMETQLFVSLYVKIVLSRKKKSPKLIIGFVTMFHQNKNKKTEIL